MIAENAITAGNYKMIQLKTPRGLPVQVPQISSEDPSVKFAPDDLARAKTYYEQNGYVIFRNLFAAASCDKIRAIWNQEVKPYAGFM